MTQYRSAERFGPDRGLGPRRGRSELATFIADDQGAVTSAFVLWMPFFLSLVMVIADVAVLFTTNANMWDAARDTARRLALHQITEDQAERHVLEHLVIGDAADYQVSAWDGSDVVVQVVTSTSSASVFGIFGKILPGELVARNHA